MEESWVGQEIFKLPPLNLSYIFSRAFNSSGLQWREILQQIPHLRDPEKKTFFVKLVVFGLMKVEKVTNRKKESDFTSSTCQYLTYVINSLHTLFHSILFTFPFHHLSVLKSTHMKIRAT